MTLKMTEDKDLMIYRLREFCQFWVGIEEGELLGRGLVHNSLT